MSEADVNYEELPLFLAQVNKNNAIGSMFWAEKEFDEAEDKEVAKEHLKRRQDAVDKAVDACDREELVTLLSLGWFDEETVDYYVEEREDTRDAIESFIGMCLQNEKFRRLLIRRMNDQTKTNLVTAIVNDRLFKGKNYEDENED